MNNRQLVAARKVFVLYPLLRPVMGTDDDGRAYIAPRKASDPNTVGARVYASDTTGEAQIERELLASIGGMP